jgi:hypothetical protein
MSDGGTNHSGWGYPTGAPNSSSYNTNLGNVGKYHSAQIVATTVTSSGAGYSAFIIGASADSATTKIFTAGGATIAGTEFGTDILYEIGVDKVQSTGGNIYIFKSR